MKDATKYLSRLDYIKSLEQRLIMEETSGIYAFWLLDSKSVSNGNFRFRVISSNKPNHEVNDDDYKELKWKWYSPESSSINYQCLYIGKSTKIKKRISQHIAPHTSPWYKNDEETSLIHKPNSTCQLRAGFEHLVRGIVKGENTINLMQEIVGFSYIPIHFTEERFYLENLAIGYYRPWFNLDSER